RQTAGRNGWTILERPDSDWLEGIYTIDPLITQLNGDESLAERARNGEPVTGEPTSSSSSPSLMALMLSALDVQHGESVLEIGTGTGYGTALLCYLVGADNITSVDIDKGLVNSARDRLAAFGYAPSLHANDGSDGVRQRAPFKRIIATVGMSRIEKSLIDQTADGGKILVPFNRRDRSGLLALLTVHEGKAEGSFLAGYGGFMPLRAERQDAAKKTLREVEPEDGEIRTADLPAEIVTGTTGSPFEFFAALTVPGGGWDYLGFTPSGSEHTETWLAQENGSWACHTTDNGKHSVRQGGPSLLWDNIESAYAEW
ncbi:MAG: protein-L-isoaspartate O-methyltransferase, partial [Pseudonocardiaceae bacterium]